MARTATGELPPSIDPKQGYAGPLPVVTPESILGAVVELPLALTTGAAAALLGGAAVELGRAIGNEEMITAGETVIAGDAALRNTVEAHPIDALKVAGGVVLAVTGVATTQGLQLAQQGLAGLLRAGDGCSQALPPPPLGSAAPPEDLPGVTVVTEAARPRRGLRRFARWLWWMWGGPEVDAP